MERSLPDQAFTLSYRGWGSGGLLDIMQPRPSPPVPVNQELDIRATSLPARCPAPTVHSTLVYCSLLLLTTMAKGMTMVTAEQGPLCDRKHESCQTCPSPLCASVWPPVCLAE